MSQYGQTPQYDPHQPAGGSGYGGSQPSGYEAPSSYGTPAGSPQGGYGDSPYGSNYGAYQPQPGYGVAPQFGHQAYGGMKAEHPQANTVLILSIIGLFTSILSFVAWYMGGNAKKEIEAGAPYVWDGSLKTGYLIGKIYSIIQLVALGIALVTIFFAFAVFAVA